MIVGISSYSYPWAVGIPGYQPANPLSAIDLIEEAVRMKVQAVQFGDNLPLHELTTETWEQVRNRAAQANISIQVGTRGLSTHNLRRYLRLAVEAQSPFLRMVIDDEAYHPNVYDVISVINQNMADIKAARVVLAIENHDRFTAQNLEWIIQQTSPEWVGICLDTTNSFGAGEDALTVASALAPYTVNLHAKEFTARRIEHKMGFVVEGARPGFGLLNLMALVDLLRQHGRCRFITLEQWPPFVNTLAETIEQEQRWAAYGVDWIRWAIGERTSRPLFVM